MGTPPLEEILASHLGTGDAPAAAGVLTTTGQIATAGPGQQPFEWASVTKLLVALSAWVAVEEGTLEWDEPAGPPGSTVAHLLAHTSGLPFEGRQPIAPPAQRRTYSNVGVEVLAEHLSRAASMPFVDYLHAAVLEPLSMAGTALVGPPSRGARGPLADLMALAGELLSPTLVSPVTLQQASAVAWPGLAGVLPGFGRHDPCDWGLGPEVRSHKAPHWTGQLNSPSTFGHFGQSGCFLWVDPPAGVALVSMSEKPFGPWAKQAWPALADAVLAATAGPGVSWRTAPAAPGG